jgi:hypothetical protein
MRRAQKQAPSRDRFTPTAVGRPVRDDADEGTLDLSDVPAAVVCAVCGQPDCAGCMPLDERTNASGVVAILPWERAGLGWPTRLWATARLMTLSHKELCSTLPEGELAAPLAFAVVAELVAAVGLAVCFAGFGLLAPDVAHVVLTDPVLRSAAGRGLAVGLPLVAGTMIVLHVLHGVIIDRAARKAGSTKRGRGLRFGLYACGWDLVTLPLGLLVLLVTDGPSGVKKAIGLAISVPNRAARAYLSGIHGLDPERTASAAKGANLLTALSALVVLLLAGVIAALAF